MSRDAALSETETGDAPDAPPRETPMPIGSRKVRKRAPALSWHVIFVDLIALLLAFFVLLFSMSELKLDAWLTIVDSFSERLNPSNDWAAPNLSQNQNAKRVWKGAGIDLDYLQALIDRRMNNAPLFKDVLIQKKTDHLLLTLPASVLFASGQAVVSDDGARLIRALGGILATVDNQIDVTGHTDMVPLTEGNPLQSNWELSLLRALKVAALLRAGGYTHTVPGFGAAESAYFTTAPEPADTRAQRARRVDIRIRAESAAVAANDDIFANVPE